MSDDLIAEVKGALQRANEPLSPRLLAIQLVDANGQREVVPYDRAGAFSPGDRVAWESPVGRLIGDVVSCEVVRGTWRLVVDWDRAMSPNLDLYLRARKDVRVSYLFDPGGHKPSERVDPLATSDGAPTIVDLLAADLQERMSATRDLITWKGVWALAGKLPALDEDALGRALLRATADDGIAQTNQVLGILGLPGPDQPNHGFAAMAINIRVAERSGWIWGSNRDGGEWLPDNALALAFAKYGQPPRLEVTHSNEQVPRVSDESLPEFLGEFVAAETIRGLDTRTGVGVLAHVLSRWERNNGVVAFDSADIQFFPDQARIALLLDGTESFALLDHAERLLRPESPAVRAHLKNSGAISFERLSSTDSFAISMETLEKEPPELDSLGILGLVTAAFDGDHTLTPAEVLARVQSTVLAETAVLARLVATFLGTYACFVSNDDTHFRYAADLPHTAVAGTESGTIRGISKDAAKAARSAEEQDRLVRQMRLADRSPHMVRAHMRKLRVGRHASPTQVAIARRHGLFVPRGSTFVRPHTRRG